MTRYENALLFLIESDDRILVMTAENRAPMKGIIGQLGNRFIDVGIAEQTLVGMAAGLALGGRRPIIHALATFLTMRAFEFIRTDVGIPNLPVILVGFVPGFLSEANGPTHQAIEDIALMRAIPGMNVFCPSDEIELAEGLPILVGHGGPWYIRFTANRRELESGRKPFAVGAAEILSEGYDISILTYGPLLRNCHEAARMIEKEGFTVRLVNMRTLEPADHGAIIDCLCSTRATFVVEDHLRRGGLSTIVAETATYYRKEFASPPVVHSLSLEDHWFKPALLPEVLEFEGFTAAGLAGRIVSIFQNEVQYAK